MDLKFLEKVNLFKSSNPSYEHLRKKWTAKNKDLSENLFDKHLRKVALTSLGGLMLLSSPNLAGNVNGQPTTYLSDSSTNEAKSKNTELSEKLKVAVPTEMRNLNKEEEEKISNVLSDELNMPIKAEIDNKRLNRTYGMIGAEQHLYRYPGDTVESHAKSADEWAMFGKSGIALGLGAWGYFAPSKAAFTPQDEEREKWYIAVQTFLSPGFSERVGEYRDFYKYRKMLVVNPKNGQAVVTDIADAGPGESTGKHLGGSPEVMHELGLGAGPRKGAVLYFFIDDPDNKIPLGPVHSIDESKLVKI